MNSKYHFKFEDLKEDERFALTSQYRRAADSIALNIAEGYPGTDLQFIKHINYAIYSTNECVSCSTKAQYRNYISDQENEDNRMYLSELTKMLSSLRKTINQRLKNN